MLGQALDHPARLAALHECGLIDDPGCEPVQRVSGLACRLLGGAGSFVTLVSADELHVVAAALADEHAPAERVTLSLCRRVVTGGEPVYADDLDAPWVRAYAAVPVVSHDGHLLGALSVVDRRPRTWTDAERQALGELGQVLRETLRLRHVEHELRQAVVQLREEARTDALTGLLNRRGWDERLDAELARARRAGTPLSVVFLDVDGLKSVNDRLGHAAGDEILEHVALVWRELVRSPDVVARIGGDEFLVLLNEADQAAAEEVASRLAHAVSADTGVSYGVAQWTGDEPGAALVARADAGLLAAKRRR